MNKGLEALKDIKCKLSELEFALRYSNQEKVPYIQEEKWNIIEKELKALEIVKKAFNSSRIYTYKLKDSLECGWITKEEYDFLKEELK